MKKIAFLSVVVSLALGSIAFAEAHEHGGKHGLFARVDADGNGKVTKAEADAGAKAFFAEVDTNKDGKLSKDELAAFRSEKLSKFEGKMSDKLWSRDANKDG